jgi:hypothetical protein
MEPPGKSGRFTLSPQLHCTQKPHALLHYVLYTVLKSSLKALSVR